ncbi:MAG: lytic murein transglycosylase [Acidobacteriota bacterium]
MTHLLVAAALTAMTVSAVGLQAPAAVTEAPPAERPSFDVWLQTLRADAVAAGISEATLAAALADLVPLPVAVERDRAQPEAVLTVDRYIERRLTRAFVRTAAGMARTHRRLLDRVGEAYGVQPRFIVAIWGLESNFGRFSGVRPTVQALATLAWDGRREALFRAELLHALRILDAGYIGLGAMKGSWAGAMGQPQFMPSSYLRFAEDFDGDGLRDIWSSHADVFASIANYLRQHGWSNRETWGREVRLPPGGADRLMAEVGRRQTGCRAEREMSQPAPLARWHAIGVRSANGANLPDVDRDAALVPAGARAFLVYGNYQALLGYNCAHAYALSVGLLADRIGS